MDKKEPVMNTAIEITGCLGEHPAGIAKYIENLYINLASENISLFPYVFLPRKRYINRVSSFIEIKNVSWHYGFLHNKKLKNNFDISHSTDTKFLKLPKTKKIATIHDLAIFKKELKNIPNFTTESFRKKIMTILNAFARQTDGIITVSQQTMDDFLELFPFYKKERIKVIYLASSLQQNIATDEQKVLDKFNIKPKSYFIFTGAVSVRKNLLNILKAYKISGLYKDYKFLIAGFPSMGFDAVKEEIKKNNLQNYVVISGYVPDDFLAALYSNAIGLVFPTYYEGFGMSIIEGMQFKIPVLAGNIGSAPEAAGGHSILASPFSVNEIAEGMKNMLDITRGKIESAYKYSKKFSWEKTSRETYEFYEETINKG